MKMDSKHNSETLPHLCQVFQKLEGPAVQRRNPRAQLFGRRVLCSPSGLDLCTCPSHLRVSMMLVCAQFLLPPLINTHKNRKCLDCVCGGCRKTITGEAGSWGTMTEARGRTRVDIFDTIYPWGRGLGMGREESQEYTSVERF